MMDEELVDQTCKGFCLHAIQYIREVAKHADPETFKAVVVNSLFLLQRASKGNFYGKVEVLFKGPEIKQVEVTRETFSMGQEFHRVFEGRGPVNPIIIRDKKGVPIAFGDGNQEIRPLIVDDERKDGD